MDRPHLIRGLRIAVSAVCGILCVMLVLLWVRSYWHWDVLQGQILFKPGFGLSSVQGRVSMRLITQGDRVYWGAVSMRVADMSPLDLVLRVPGLGFAIRRDANLVFIAAPHWFLVAVTAALAGAVQVKQLRRFSLRTLLIATTLIAVLLATAAYLRLW